MRSKNLFLIGRALDTFLHMFFFILSDVFRALREDMGNIFKRMQDLNLKQEAENQVRWRLGKLKNIMSRIK